MASFPISLCADSRPVFERPVTNTRAPPSRSICTVILRELRVARGIHQAVLADHCGKPPSFWEKIEAGKTKLDFETILRVCRGLGIVPSVVMQTAERYTWALRDRGWSVVFTDIGNADVLMEQAPKYWTSPGYRF